MIPVGIEEIRSYGLIDKGQYDGFAPGWWIQDRSASGLYCNTEDTWYWFCIPLQAGSIISSISVKWGSNIAGDGIKTIGLKRNDQALDYNFTTIIDEEQFLKPAGAATVFLNDLDMIEFTIEAPYSYYLVAKSIWTAGGINLYSLNIGTKARFL